MSWVNFVMFDGDSLDPENVFGDLDHAEVRCCLARARFAKFLDKPKMMVVIFHVDGDVEREVEDRGIIKLKVDGSLTSSMSGANTSTSNLATTYRVVLVGMGRLFPQHYNVLEEMDAEEALEYWSMTILQEELFDDVSACPAEVAAALAACAPPNLLQVHLENILRRRWQITIHLQRGPRHSDEVCTCGQSEAAACDCMEDLVDNVLAYDLEGFHETDLSALCKHIAALSFFLNDTSGIERGQICSLSALVQDLFVDLFQQCMDQFSARPRGIIYYNMHVCLLHQARACWAKRGWPFPRSSLHEHMMNNIHRGLLQDPENVYWEASDFKIGTPGWGFALAYAKEHDDDHVQKALPLSYANISVHGSDVGPNPAMSSTYNRSTALPESTRLPVPWSGATMEVYKCPATLRRWFWHPESGFHCFQDKLCDEGWEMYTDVTGQYWWWNPATEDWFLEVRGKDM